MEQDAKLMYNIRNKQLKENPNVYTSILTGTKMPATPIELRKRAREAARARRPIRTTISPRLIFDDEKLPKPLMRQDTGVSSASVSTLGSPPTTPKKPISDIPMTNAPKKTRKRKRKSETMGGKTRKKKTRRKKKRKSRRRRHTKKRRKKRRKSRRRNYKK